MIALAFDPGLVKSGAGFVDTWDSLRECDWSVDFAAVTGDRRTDEPIDVRCAGAVRKLEEWTLIMLAKHTGLPLDDMFKAVDLVVIERVTGKVYDRKKKSGKRSSTKPENLFKTAQVEVLLAHRMRQLCTRASIVYLSREEWAGKGVSNESARARAAMHFGIEELREEKHQDRADVAMLARKAILRHALPGGLA